VSESNEAFELVQLVNQGFDAVDRRDWDTYRSLLAEEISIEYVGVSGPTPTGQTKSDVVVANSRAALDVIQVTHHMITNHVVTIADDLAAVTFHEQALHYQPALSDDVKINTWILFATAHRRLLRTPDGWRICSLGLKVIHSIGNPNLLRDVASLRNH
jgi:ketosteroid isomerase-like protein